MKDISPQARTLAHSIKAWFVGVDKPKPLSLQTAANLMFAGKVVHVGESIRESLKQLTLIDVAYVMEEDGVQYVVPGPELDTVH